MTSEKVMRAREQGPEAGEVADRLFFETVVRIHRAGEGEPYTGLKPAGLDHGESSPWRSEPSRPGPRTGCWTS